MPLPEDVQKRQTETPGHHGIRQRRVVSKGEFVRTIGKKLGLFSLSGTLLATALVLALITMVSLYFGAILFVIAFGIVTIAVFWASTRFFVQAKKVEAVRPLTNRISHLLPPEESLVRAADAPPTQQQAELLRAAQSSQDTPAEELLRPASENRQEM